MFRYKKVHTHMYKNLHKRELEYIKPSTLGKGNNIIEHILCVRHTSRLFFIIINWLAY